MNFFKALILFFTGLFGAQGAAIAPAAPVPVPATSTAPVAIERPIEAPAIASTTTPSFAGSPWKSSLPLGDGKYTTAGPKKGYIYVCHVAQGGGGAQGTGSWIHGSSWNPDEKIAVEGSVSWPQASYRASVSGSDRIIAANGLPTGHATGIFPIAASDPASQVDRNPNSIKTQDTSITLPAYPTPASAPQCIFGQVGIMNDGVALYDGFDAEYRDAVAHEVQDSYEGHPDERGQYHYHGFESYIKDLSASSVVGFAFDGYPITGPKLSSGGYLFTNDLDECHGTTSAIMLDGKETTSYHYVLTQDFPYSVSCFKGVSHEPKPGPATGSSAQAPTSGVRTPPQAAIDACAGSSSGASCSFRTPNGSITGTCETPPGTSALACVPAR